MALYLGSNKVVKGNYKGGVDASGVTATAADVLSPKVIVDKDGVEYTGTIPTKTSDDITVSGATITTPTGYYASDVEMSVATATQATPSISVSNSGKITAAATQSAGYVSSGTKSATKQLTTKGATTWTPSTSDQTISSGVYLTETQTIKGDSNLVAKNIAEGISIFGVTGICCGITLGLSLSERDSATQMTPSFPTTDLVAIYLIADRSPTSSKSTVVSLFYYIDSNYCLGMDNSQLITASNSTTGVNLLDTDIVNVSIIDEYSFKITLESTDIQFNSGSYSMIGIYSNAETARQFLAV